MDEIDFEELDETTIGEHVFDIVVNRAPDPEADLGFFNRTDGECVVQLKIPDKGTSNSNSRKRKKKTNWKKGHSDETINTATEFAMSTLEISVVQSMSLLNSRTESSTTGAMLWRVSVVFAEWFYQHFYYPSKSKLLEDRFDVIELGCGAAALLPIALGSSPRIKTYIATDQPHIARLAQHNVQRHYTETLGISAPDNIHVVDYDWEEAEQDCSNIANLLKKSKDDGEDEAKERDNGLLVLACDTIYNEYLISHFLDALIRACQLSNNQPAHVLVAQQVRDPVIMESFLTQFVECPQFKVWSIPDSCLSAEFKHGFVLHYAKFIPH